MRTMDTTPASSAATTPDASPAQSESSSVGSRSTSSSASSAMESAAGGSWPRSSNHFVELPLGECLQQSLDVFQSCKTKWGLVTDVRADGSTYLRHGIIAELTADVTRAVETADESTYVHHCARLRQAIDLVKLALAVDPQALTPLLLRRTLGVPQLSVNDYSQNPEMDEDELRALTRGHAPFELHICLKICATKAKAIELAKTFMQKLDEQDVGSSHTSPMTLRRYLTENARSTTAARRLTDVPVRAVLVIAPFSESPDRKMEPMTSQYFFKCWTSATVGLYLYQSQRVGKWDMERHLAPLVIERIKLNLCLVPVSKSVVEAIMAMVNDGIPVSSSAVCLDIRFVSCEEHELQLFLETISRGLKGPLTIKTGPTTYEPYEAADIHHEDYSARIRMILRCVGRLAHDVKLEVGCLFMVCETRRNRAAFFRGLFDDVLGREYATSISLLDNEASDDDVRLLNRHARRWHQAWPDKKLCLRSLVWLPNGEGTDFIRALMDALDDVEELSLHPNGDALRGEEIDIVLQFPSLRSLCMDQVNIPSLDVIDTSLGPEPKPALETLELSGLTLADSSSLVRFINRLDPRNEDASLLSKTLHTLGIAETDGSTRAARPSDQALIRRAVNDPAAVPALERVLATNKVLQYVNFLGNFANFPVRLACAPFANPPKKSIIPASAKKRQSDIVKARSAAFLSAFRDGHSQTLRYLDSNVVKLILAFSAPHTVRKIRV